MLDSSKDGLKMDAMKRIINVSHTGQNPPLPSLTSTLRMFQLVAKGKDVSELFPAVVKNVAAKNLEVFQREPGDIPISHVFS